MCRGGRGAGRGGSEGLQVRRKEGEKEVSTGGSQLAWEVWTTDSPKKEKEITGCGGQDVKEKRERAYLLRRTESPSPYSPSRPSKTSKRKTSCR